MACFPANYSEDIFEALQCPVCDTVYMESLWSLFSHLAQSHTSIPLAALSFDSLEKMKKFVPKSRVSIVRPAFTEHGGSSEYLASLLPSKMTKVTSALSVEVAERGAKSVIEQQMRKQQMTAANCGGGDDGGVERPSELPVEIKYICMQCGEQIGDSSAVAQHKAQHHDTSAAEENAISTLVALSSNAESLRCTEAMNPLSVSTSPSLSPYKEDTELPSMKVRKPALSKPRRPILNSAMKNSNLSCMHCGEVFHNKCKLTKHLMDHKLARNPYRCPYKDCLQSYEIKNKFKNHLLRQHHNLSAAEFTRLLDEGDKEAEKLKKLEQKIVMQEGLRHPKQTAVGFIQNALEQMIKENTNANIPIKVEEMELSTSPV